MGINYKESVCPACGGHIPMSWLKFWAWCVRCNRMWRVVSYAGKTRWFYVEPIESVKG